MKNLVSRAPMRTEWVEVPEKVITADDQVKIKLTYCGVCMSEHYDWMTATKERSFGHEPVGVVTEVGAAVKAVKVGDRVSGLFSGNAEYAVAAEKCVFKLPDCISDTEGVLEPLACLMSAVSKVRIGMIGERVAVVGCGYMGCGAIGLLKLRGAYVVAVDISPESVKNALQYGADEAYLVEDLPANYRYVPGGGLNFDGEPGGFSLVMEWGETNESLDLAIQMTRQCGQLAIGAYHTGEKRLVDVQQLNVKAIDCLSTHPREAHLTIEGCKNAIRLMASGAWNYKHVPTKVYPRSMFDAAQADLPNKFGKYLKAVIDMSGREFEPYIIE